MIRSIVLGVMSVLLAATAAQAATWTVDAGGSGQFTTIQAAINAASPLDTINVMAGVYSERLNISIPLTLLGPQASVNPTVSGARTSASMEAVITKSGIGAPNPDVLIDIPTGVSGVTISGFTLRGDLTNTNADTSTVRGWNSLSVSNNIMEGMYAVLYKGGTGLTVAGNRVTANKSGVTVQPNPASQVTVSGNTFTLGGNPQTDRSAVYMTGATDVTISDNTAISFATGGGRGIGGSNLTRVTVSGNDLTGNNDGISFYGNTTFVDIDGNTLDNCGRYGINIKGQDIDITNNELVGNGTAGIYVAVNTIPTRRVTVSSNNIYDNTSYGLLVATSMDLVEAHGNWWGDATGPFDNKSLPGMPDYNNLTGLGDAVSSYVDYANWASQPVPEPATLALLGLGGGLALLKRRRNRK
jgi:hypothetical protein